VIKIRNPVSDINIVINVFKKLYLEFSNVEYFDLDNIAEFFAREKLASSSGYTGDEALRRSYTVTDNSRKSMRMQAKSYTELYKILGWINSVNNAALNFNFTYIGLHVAVSGEVSRDLFEQCLLSVNYPNHILNVKFPDVNKPFFNMLVFAERLDGKLHRDEILLGAMNLANGYSEKEISQKIELIRSLRKTKSILNLNKSIQELSVKNKMKPNSIKNLTRFVISSLVFTGWFEKTRLKIYGNNAPFLVLTPKGKNVIKEISEAINIKGDDLVNMPYDVKMLSELSLLNMLGRAGFKVDSDICKFKELENSLLNDYGKSKLFFSPYQYFSKKELEDIFPNHTVNFSASKINTTVERIDEQTIRLFKSEKFISPLNIEKSKNEILKNTLVKRLAESDNDSELATKQYIFEIYKMKQQEFYPFVAGLLGFIFNREAFPPSAGNNNMRYDVIIPDAFYSIPVEVKSPTEEEMLSIKAIRQALENKILLLARKPYITTYEISSFAVGFNIPNIRSDIYKLIEEIYQIYKINIAIMDMKILISTAFYCALTENHYDVSEFKNIRGVIRFGN
jgi:hypothetical protein